MKLATVCYIKKDWKTLMIHRNKRDDDHHKWKWNGLWWKFDFWESPEDCMKREVKEESGIDVLSFVMKWILTFPNFQKGEDWIVFVFVINEFEWDIKYSNNEWDLHRIDDDKLTELNVWEWDRLFFERMKWDKIFSSKMNYSKEWKLLNYEVKFY